MAQGFVYILVSPNSNFIKIGGTERPISERLRGINGTESYADHGPWLLSDFLHNRLATRRGGSASTFSREECPGCPRDSGAF